MAGFSHSEFKTWILCSRASGWGCPVENLRIESSMSNVRGAPSFGVLQEGQKGQGMYNSGSSRCYDRDQVMFIDAQAHIDDRLAYVDHLPVHRIFPGGRKLQIMELGSISISQQINATSEIINPRWVMRNRNGRCEFRTKKSPSAFTVFERLQSL